MYTEFLPCLQNPGRPLPTAQSLGDGRAGPALLLTLAPVTPEHGFPGPVPRKEP